MRCADGCHLRARACSAHAPAKRVLAASVADYQCTHLFPSCCIAVNVLLLNSTHAAVLLGSASHMQC
jgi:hypothetical protein